MKPSLSPELAAQWINDDSTLKNGQSLAAPAKWQSAGCNERALWGEIKGSGKDPYRTIIDLSGPAYKCSCPSKKFPCKHSAGLLLRYVGNPASVAEAEPPEWAADWLNKREAKAADKTAPAPPAKTPSAKAVAARDKAVAEGLDELERWLHDVAREGLAAYQNKRAKTINDRIRRLTDAKANGAAALLRPLAAVPESEWPTRALEVFGKLQLLINAFRRIDELPPNLQQETRNQLGFTVQKNTVLASQPLIEDHWLVIGRRETEEDDLTVQRNWLLGYETGRYALVLNYFHRTQTVDHTLIPGAVFRSELAYFPAAYPLRAALREPAFAEAPALPLASDAHFEQLLKRMAQALAANPWLDSLPALLTGVTPLRNGERWLLADENLQTLPLNVSEDFGWKILALSGGQPITVSAEWDGRALTPFLALS